jgi:alpha-1,2-mannosyltransferase
MMTTAMFIVVKEILRSHRLAEVWTPWLGAIGMWTLPVYLTLRLGQVNSLVVLPIVFDLVLLRRGSRWAGVGIGFAAALKLTPLLFIPFLLINGSLRRSGWTALATTTGLTVFAAAVRWHDSVRYWTKEIRATNRVGHLDSVLSSAFRRFTVWLPGPPVVSTLVWLVGSLALLGLVLAASRRLVARGLLPDLFVVIGVAACIVSPISWGHHLFFAVPALLVAAIRFRGRWSMVAALVCLAIFIDPFERGQGPFFSALQGVIMVVFVVAVCAQEIGTGLASTRSSSAEHRVATLSGDGGI